MANEKKIDRLVVDDTAYETVLTTKYRSRKTYVPYDPKKLYAVIPGVIKELYVKRGDRVTKKDKLFLLEAMKMYNTVTSPMEGVIKSVNVTTGKMVAKGDLILEFE